MNRFGICEWVFPERGPEAIRHAARLGFDGIQLTEAGGSEAGFPLLKEDLQEQYIRARDETGIAFQALHLFSLCRLASMIHPLNSPAGRVADECIRAAVRVCRALDIQKIMVTSGFLCSIKNRLDFDVFAQQLKNACHIAKEEGVRIVFESALNAVQLAEMRSIVGDGLYVCYDTFNPVRFHMETAPELEIPMFERGYIDHFHLKDGPEDMVGCSLLGEGAGNFKAVAESIRAAGYGDGWMITENYYDSFPLNSQGDFDTLAKADLATMRREFS